MLRAGFARLRFSVRYLPPIRTEDRLNFEPAPIPSFLGPGRSADGVREAIKNWVRSEALEGILRAWHADVVNTSDTRGRLKELERFSAERWDFRGGVERNFIVEANDAREDLVMAAAEALGMRGETEPTQDKYSHMLVLGGLVRACLGRPQYAARLVRSRIRTDAITGLGGFRRLSDDERELAAAAGVPDVIDETDAIDQGLRLAFQLEREPTDERGADGDSPHSRWLHRRYTDSSPMVSVVAAPSSDPDARRANTPDTYRWWAEKVAHLSSSDRILLVTTDIYVPYQGANAIRMLGLPYGAEVETIGLDARNLSDQALRQPFGTQKYLQEVRSTIRAFSDLWDATIE